MEEKTGQLLAQPTHRCYPAYMTRCARCPCIHGRSCLIAPPFLPTAHHLSVFSRYPYLHSSAVVFRIRPSLPVLPLICRTHSVHGGSPTCDDSVHVSQRVACLRIHDCIRFSSDSILTLCYCYAWRRHITSGPKVTIKFVFLLFMTYSCNQCYCSLRRTALGM